ncbi:Mth938-like domain-containing protein [Halanaerobacter jeridensis]|uniref:Mth938-like domain-containing protein n=1 Tax=Halanaerobacter jeridensis TaxID=706427 RepID=A0A938XPU8_9FIRM|nr:MTH938/NDUFAF3 family protein [Halanaerobacter jeridensis]MBM7555284.1 hypothetical protein [Halanaerobacter jeridensis]
MEIKNYSFGEMVIDNQKYSSDLLICDEEIKADWWREEGHSLCRNDLTWVLKQKPDLLIIGTGKSGVMTVPQNLRQDLTDDLELIVEKTNQAVKTFNEQQKNNLKVAAGFHLTC